MNFSKFYVFFAKLRTMYVQLILFYGSEVLMFLIQTKFIIPQIDLLAFK
jgi:hypothetical protein